MNNRPPPPCRAAAIATFAICLLSTAAQAEPTAQDRETARTLLLDGRKKMAAQEYTEALKMFRAAHAIMNVPTTGLALARAQVALHMLIEARETAVAVTKIPVDPGDAKVFATARTEAGDLAASLLGRIPSLTVVVNGLPSDRPPSVTVDGAPIPEATVGLARKLNPGKHTVQIAASGFVSETREIELPEGVAHTETIELKPDRRTGTAPPTVAAPPAGAASSSTSAGSPGVTSRPTAIHMGDSGSPARGQKAGVPSWVWISGGLGLAATGAGVAFLIDHLDARQTLQNDCPDNVCDRGRYDLESMTSLRARWNRDLALSLGFGAAGLAGLGAAVIGLVAAPRANGGSARVEVGPWAGASHGGLSVAGSF